MNVQQVRWQCIQNVVSRRITHEPEFGSKLSWLFRHVLYEATSAFACEKLFVDCDKPMRKKDRLELGITIFQTSRIGQNRSFDFLHKREPLSSKRKYLRMF
jgi:hypothetical protein